MLEYKFKCFLLLSTLAAFNVVAASAWHPISSGEFPSLGKAYDSLTENFRPGNCVEENQLLPLQFLPQGQGKFSIKQGLSQLEMVNLLRGSIEAEIPVLPFVSGRGQASFVGETSTNELRQNFVLSYEYVAGTKSFSFFPEFLRLNGLVKSQILSESSVYGVDGKEVAFRICGNSFVDQILYGYSIYVVLTLEFRNLASKMVVESCIAADIGSGPMTMENLLRVTAKLTDRKMEEDVSVKLQIWQEGGFPGKVLELLDDNPTVECANLSEKGKSCTEIFEKLGKFFRGMESWIEKNPQYLTPLGFSHRNYPSIPPFDILPNDSLLGRLPEEDELRKKTLRDPIIDSYQKLLEKENKFSFYNRRELIDENRKEEISTILRKSSDRHQETWGRCWLNSALLSASQIFECQEKIIPSMSKELEKVEISASLQPSIRQWISALNKIEKFQSKNPDDDKEWQLNFLPKIETFKIIAEKYCNWGNHQEFNEKKCEETLENLKELNISNKSIESLYSLGALKCIEAINASNNPLSLDFDFFAFSKLKHLNLAFTRLNKSMPLTQFKAGSKGEEKTLTLDGNQIDDLDNFLGNEENPWSFISLKNAKRIKVKKMIKSTPVRCLDLRKVNSLDLSGLKRLEPLRGFFAIVLSSNKIGSCPFERSEGNLSCVTKTDEENFSMEDCLKLQK